MGSITPNSPLRPADICKYHSEAVCLHGKFGCQRVRSHIPSWSFRSNISEHSRSYSSSVYPSLSFPTARPCPASTISFSLEEVPHADVDRDGTQAALLGPDVDERQEIAGLNCVNGGETTKELPFLVGGLLLSSFHKSRSRLARETTMLRACSPWPVILRPIICNRVPPFLDSRQ